MTIQELDKNSREKTFNELLKSDLLCVRCKNMNLICCFKVKGFYGNVGNATKSLFAGTTTSASRTTTSASGTTASVSSTTTIGQPSISITTRGFGEYHSSQNTKELNRLKPAAAWTYLDFFTLSIPVKSASSTTLASTVSSSATTPTSTVNQIDTVSFIDQYFVAM